MDLNKVLVKFLPPILIDSLRYLKDYNFHEWEYVQQGWRRIDPAIKGWNDISILNKQKEKWVQYIKSIDGNKPLGISHESNSSSYGDYASHNTMISYAYVLALISHKKENVSMLDWGGGIGHYYVLSKALMPCLKLDYHCKELPILCKYGHELFPEAHFYNNDEDCFKNSYDFILASSSLHYVKDWKITLHKLANATNSYIYITRLPIVNNSTSFVVVQRPYRYGYNTEYLGWFINRKDFLEYANSLKLKLIREFLIQEKPYVHKAPEQGEYRGFLFKKER